MTDIRQDINYVRAEVHESKQELALARIARDLAQVDFHRKRLLQLEGQLSSLHEQQTILLRSSQQVSPVPSLTSVAALSDRQVHQPPLLDANEKAADQVVDSLQYHGYGWLKVSAAETQSFHELQHYCTSGSCMDEAGDLLRDKRLLEYSTGSPNPSLPSAMCTAANKVCKLMDCHARRVLQAISRSRHIGVASSSLNCNLNSVDSPNSLEDSSCLHIARYLSSLEWDPNDAHIDRGLLTLVWSDCTSGLQVANPQAGKLIDVKLPEGYVLVLTGYTLEHVTCGIFKAAPHNVDVLDPAIQRLSFAYKLRCPPDGVVTQYNNLSANSKQLDQQHMKGITVEALMVQFDEYRWSINHAGTDLVGLGLSPEWQHAVNEWRSTRHLVDDEWIWDRLVSTMGWQRPYWQVFVKTGSGRMLTLKIHHTWTVAGLESILEILHGANPPGSFRILGAGRQLESHRTLGEQKNTGR